MFAARTGGARLECMRTVFLMQGTTVRTPARRRGALIPTTIHRRIFSNLKRRRSTRCFLSLTPCRAVVRTLPGIQMYVSFVGRSQAPPEILRLLLSARPLLREVTSSSRDPETPAFCEASSPAGRRICRWPPRPRSAAPACRSRCCIFGASRPR